MNELEAMPDDVRRVVDLGRFGPGPSPDADARMRARLAATTGVALGVAGASVIAHASAGVRTSLVAGKSLVALALALAVGAAGGIGGTLAWTHRAPRDAAPVVATVPAVVMVPVPVTIPRPIVIAPPAPPAVRDHLPPPAKTAQADHAPAPSDLTAESALVERARTALERGNAAGALAAIRDHERRFPRGQLVEEREAIAIQALAAAGSLDAARDRARRFHAERSPSMFDAIVDRATGERTQP